jgi:hypothetical protein
MNVLSIRELACSTIVLAFGFGGTQSEGRSLMESSWVKIADQQPCRPHARHCTGTQHEHAPPQVLSPNPVENSWAPPSVEGYIFLRLGKDKLDGYVEYRPIVETRQSPASLSVSVLNLKVQISLNGQGPQNGQVQAVSPSEGVARISLNYPWPHPPPIGDYHVRIAGLLPQEIAKIRLAVTLVLDSNIHLNSVLPVNWSSPTSGSSHVGSEWISLRFDEFRENSLIIGLHTEKVSPWSALQGSPITGYVVTQILALVVLFVTMTIKGLLVLKAVQRNELERIRLRLLQVEQDPTDHQRKSDLILYIKELQTKAEYGAFHRKFTEPLDEIIGTGLTNDVRRYRESVNKMKLKLRPSWALFR